MSWAGPASGPRTRPSPMRGSRIFFRRIDQVAQKIDSVPAAYSLPRDPDDEPYLNLALAANADYLVTWDKDMLDLMQDEGFRTQYPQLTILNPVALLQVLPLTPEEQP